MARADNLKDPTPTVGASKATVDAVLTIFKAGNALLSLLSGLLASVLILYSGYVLYDSFSTEYRAYSSSWDLLKYKPEIINDEPSEGAAALIAINEDYRSWLTIYNTTIDYPVVQGENDLYYASHDIYRNSSLTGAIYLAAGNSADFSDSYNLIYGHHMDNGAMFGSLDRFANEAYFHEYQEGILVTREKIYDITLFAVISTDAYENQVYMVGHRASEVIAFLTGDRSGDVGLGTEILVYDENVARDADHIVALSTCANAETNGRLVVFAKMTEHVIDDETPTTDEPVTAEPTTDTPTTAAPPTAAPTTVAPTTAAPTTAAPATDVPTDAPTTGDPTAAPTTASPTTAAPTTAAPTTAAPTTAAPTTATPAKTHSPTLTEPVTLTVQYEAEGETVFPELTFIYTPGDQYYVVSPVLPGYNVDIEIVQGTIYEDMVVVVHYTPVPYTLTICYVFMDGTTAAQTYTVTVYAGESYDVISPTIEGYITLKPRIQGTNPGRNETYTVVYVPVDRDIVELITLEDYETPLNLDHIYMQIGVCVE